MEEPPGPADAKNVSASVSASAAEAPVPIDPRWRRLSRLPLPPYCFVPGRSPHPRRDPAGHSYGRPEPRAGRVKPEEWRSSAIYCHGIDLYNLGYFWESHEAFEALWRAAGDPVARDFFQGIIQIAAANLKWRMGASSAALALAGRGVARLASAPPIYMGIDVRGLRALALAYFKGEATEPPAISLADEAAGAGHA